MKTQRDPAMELAFHLATEAQNLTAAMMYVSMFNTGEAALPPGWVPAR